MDVFAGLLVGQPGVQLSERVHEAVECHRAQTLFERKADVLVPVSCSRQRLVHESRANVPQGCVILDTLDTNPVLSRKPSVAPTTGRDEHRRLLVRVLTDRRKVSHASGLVESAYVALRLP